MKPISGKDLCRVVKKKGWILDRISGSHYIFVKDKDVPSLSIPVHGSKELRPGIQAKLMKQAGLTDADL